MRIIELFNQFSMITMRLGLLYASRNDNYDAWFRKQPNKPKKI